LDAVSKSCDVHLRNTLGHPSAKKSQKEKKKKLQTRNPREIRVGTDDERREEQGAKDEGPRGERMRIKKV
jgi:hypothetical protein